jgi:hypothetical protein
VSVAAGHRPLGASGGAGSNIRMGIGERGNVTSGESDHVGHGPMAGELVAMPGVWRRLLAAHVPDRLGRCVACRSSGGSGARWPCSLHSVAAEAQRLYELSLGQATGGE